MPEAKFVLKNPESNKSTLIYLFYNFNYKRLKYSTGEKILPKYWSAENQQVRLTKDFIEASELNTRLNNMKSKINDIYRRLINDGIEPTPDMLRSLLNDELIGRITTAKISLFDFIQKYIDEGVNVKKTGTIKTYITFQNHLKNFAKKKKRSIDFNDITLEFYNDIIAYLTNEIKLSPNSIGSFIKNLKSILNEATERGINNNLEFRKKKFLKPKELTDQIYLTIEDLEKLYNLDLSNKRNFERVRDLFIVGCFTGLRFSDYFQINSDNIVEGNKLKIKSIKTNTLSIIPLHPIVLEILKKYDYTLPKPITNQKMNEYLKDIGKEAKLNEPVTMSKIKGGKKEVNTLPKHQLISTHSARRSFATNAYKANVPIVNLMKITGHSQEKTFLQYIRISQEENANSLLYHPFFS